MPLRGNLLAISGLLAVLIAVCFVGTWVQSLTMDMAEYERSTALAASVPFLTAQTRQSRPHSGAMEGFATLEQAQNVVHEKNTYYNAHMRHFFSGGEGTVQADTILFHPSLSDVACTTMTDNITGALDCDSATLDTVSVADKDVVDLMGHQSCRSLAVARQPLHETDASLRLLSGMYRFLKTCVTLPYESMVAAGSGDDGGDGDGAERLSLVLPPTSPTSLFFVLNRPVFVAADSSYLYKVEYEDGQAATLTRGSLEEANGDPETRVTLRRVSDNRMWKPSPTATSLKTMHPETNGEVNVTLYYLRYLWAINRKQNEAPLQRNVATLAFRLTTQKVSESNAVWFRSPNTSGGLEVRLSRPMSQNDGTDTATVSVQAGGQTAEIEVGDRGYLVLVWSTDLLTLAYMSRTKVRTLRKAGLQRLNITDRQAFDDEVRDKAAAVPGVCYPNGTYNIPNLYDVFTRLVAFS